MVPKLMQPLAHASAVAIVTRGLTAVLGLSCTLLLARVMSHDVLASYWIVISALSLIALIAQTGVGQVAISLVSQAIARHDMIEARRVSSNALAVVLVAGLVIGSAVTAMLASGILLGGRIVSPAALILTTVGGVLCPVAMQLVDNLRAQQRLKTSTWLAAQPASGGIVPSTIMLVGLVLLFVTGSAREQTEAMVYGLFLGGWLITLLLAATVLARPTHLAPSATLLSLAAAKSLLMRSGHVLSGAVAMFVINQADLWFVNLYLGAEQTAAYGLAATLVKYVSAVNVLLGALLPGLVGQLWAQGETTKLVKVLVMLGRVSAAVALLVTLAIGLLGERLLVAAAGPAYAGAWLPLAYLSIGHLINSLFGYSQVLLVTAGVLRPIARASAVATLITFTALAFLTPWWGMAGAAIAAAAGIAVYNTIIYLSCFRATGIACHVFVRTHALDNQVPKSREPNP